ncbi:ATP-dependent RNA helicase RhlE [hydrothermal vent metagenome]|uniref:ATP-dependent RNA helicase RhlE n=1 Tax=hydrothermal vent metagenome TaxID=652676 RepID=A0A3B0TXW7_9ZZZZ
MNELNFSGLGLGEPILRALQKKNYTEPTPIQAQAIPELLSGGDMMGIAQTGTGKTAAFALPILHQLNLSQSEGGKRKPKALILAPSRELAIQISDEIRAYGQFLALRQTVIVGGVSQKSQVSALQRGVDIIISTPGRLLDLMNQRHVQLDEVCHFVLDEADRMLDMGFINDMRKIIAAIPKKRQSLLFSATMSTEIERLARTMLNDPLRIEITPQATTVEKIEQSVIHLNSSDKRNQLSSLLEDAAYKRVIVFARTKHRANKIAQQLEQVGVKAEAIHGNKSQGARQRALKNFKSGQIRVLVATDILARGIDVDGVSHVINFELPNEAESYVHRIGRTARAGAGGIALSFCDPSERAYLKDIEKLVRHKLTVIGDEPTGPIPAAKAKPARGGKRGPGKPKNRTKFSKNPGQKPANANGGQTRSRKRRRAA